MENFIAYCNIQTNVEVIDLTRCVLHFLEKGNFLSETNDTNVIKKIYY